MRQIPSNLAASLAGETTTLARCWRLSRLDGTVLGFTDHDRDLAFGGTTYAARSGLDAAETTSELGFAVGGGEVAGALVAAFLTETDLAAGRFDGATVETWLVDWSDVERRMLLDIATIGEVTRSEHAFTAELRGLMHQLDEPRGEIYRRDCAADLGDNRCGIDLNASTYRASAAVQATDGRLGFTTLGLASFASGWFSNGRLTWTSGASTGLAVEIKLHALSATIAEIVLWQPATRAIAPGDGFVVTAGCDKRHATCRDRFGNIQNFRGFPHIPGTDQLVRYHVNSAADLDGGSLFR